VTKSVNDIWDRIQTGDHRAWKLLVQKYDALVNTVAIRCGLTGADVEDCAQYTWVALYRCRKSIKDPKALPKWLMQTARRRAVRMLQSSRRTTVADDGISIDPRPLPDEELLQLERRQELEEALSYLDDRCRRLIEELFFSPQGRSYADVARKLGIPANSLGPIRSRCLARLRQILDDLGYLP
jgi:RNA polymerase sigma factor (sigma-70 family)